MRVYCTLTPEKLVTLRCFVAAARQPSSGLEGFSPSPAEPRSCWVNHGKGDRPMYSPSYTGMQAAVLTQECICVSVACPKKDQQGCHEAGSGKADIKNTKR